jgi:hypothetical protein
VVGLFLSGGAWISRGAWLNSAQPEPVKRRI